VYRDLPLQTQRICLVGLLAIAVALAAPRPSFAKYNPEHPEVQALVKKGIGFLEENNHYEDGGKVLVGLAVLKGQKNKNHPRILEAVEIVKKMASTPDLEVSGEGPVYSVGVAIIFLCELDPVKYRPEIQTMLNWMLKSQKPFGGWGYLHGAHVKTGDTSMTQYGVLSMWTATRNGFTVPDHHVVAVTNWLMRTQDPSGGWGYQGKDPGNFNLVPQSPVTPSLTAAGTGSLYVAGDVLGLKEVREEKGSDLPPGVKLIEKKDDLKRKPTNMVDMGRYNSALNGGNNWFAKNGGIHKDIPWVYYYMYALERYMSFYEYAKFGGHQEEAAWYDAGVEFLKKEVSNKGSWTSQSGEVAGTCFAVLFLVRSTRKSIEKASKPVGGELAGGKGLSGAIANARVQNGKVVTKEEDEKNIFEDIDSLIGQINSDVGTTIDLPPKIMLPKDLSEREQQLKKLRKLVSAERFEARMLAVNTLSSEHSLDNAPVLIYALTDPDNRVAIAARDELRFLSRRFTGFGMPDEPTAAQKTTAAERWRQWYYALRPDAEEREEIILP
jgi:hypothetical protein